MPGTPLKGIFPLGSPVGPTAGAHPRRGATPQHQPHRREADALQGSCHTARASFVSAFLGTSWSRASREGWEGGRGEAWASNTDAEGGSTVEEEGNRIILCTLTTGQAAHAARG